MRPSRSSCCRLSRDDRARGCTHYDGCTQYATRFYTNKANLLEEGSFDEAVTGCGVVLHTASPFSSDASMTEDDFCRPAVQGTLNVLGSLKRKARGCFVAPLLLGGAMFVLRACCVFVCGRGSACVAAKVTLPERPVVRLTAIVRAVWPVIVSRRTFQEGTSECAVVQTKKMGLRWARCG